MIIAQVIIKSDCWKQCQITLMILLGMKYKRSIFEYAVRGHAINGALILQKQDDLFGSIQEGLSAETDYSQSQARSGAVHGGN